MNEKQKKWKFIVAGLMAGLLIGGTVAVTTPSVAAGPAKVWKQIKKKADKRYYTKAKSNKKYSQKPTVLRGAIVLASTPVSGYAMTHIDFGVTLSAAPTPHIIASAGVVPAGCSGTPASPSASPGHLCIFEQASSGFGARVVCSATNSCGATSRFGAFYFANSTTATGFLYGSWALGVDSFTTARLAQLGVTGTTSGRPGDD